MSSVWIIMRWDHDNTHPCAAYLTEQEANAACEEANRIIDLKDRWYDCYTVERLPLGVAPPPYPALWEALTECEPWPDTPTT